MIYTEAPLAGVGMTESQAREAGLDVMVATTSLAELARSATDGSDAGQLILVADRNQGTLVGAGIVGAGADDWISEARVAIRGQVPIRILADVIHPFPPIRRRMKSRCATWPGSWRRIRDLQAPDGFIADAEDHRRTLVRGCRGLASELWRLYFLKAPSRRH